MIFTIDERPFKFSDEAHECCSTAVVCYICKVKLSKMDDLVTIFKKILRIRLMNCAYLHFTLE